MCISIYRNMIVDSDSDSDSMIGSINYNGLYSVQGILPIPKEFPRNSVNSQGI